MNEDQRQYELMFILSPELEEKDIALFQEEIRHSIEGLSGRITKQEKPEKRNLSYQIKKCSSAYYLIINFLIAQEKAPINNPKNTICAIQIIPTKSIVRIMSFLTIIPSHSKG